MSGPTSDLLNGLADLLATNSVGVHRETGTYTVDEWAIAKDQTPQFPDRVISLRPYRLVADYYPTSSSVIGLQLATRGRTRAEERDKQDEIFQLLHAREDLTFGSVHVASIQWRSAVPLGSDDSTRWESTSNYALLTDDPPTSNRPD